MVEWALRDRANHVLEPSFGDGQFLNAIRRFELQNPDQPIRISGVEIDEQVFRQTVSSGNIDSSSALLADFLNVEPFPVDSIVGNPPFVRIRHLGQAEADAAINAAKNALGSSMDPSGSVWMPFVLHAARFLIHGGRLALVLPFDATYVRYARPFWTSMARNFGRLEIIRVKQRLFPEILQDVVILLAGDKGRTTDTVFYRAYKSVKRLLLNRPEVDSRVAVGDIERGARSFIWSHVSDELRELIGGKLASQLRAAGELVRFNIGYVAGDKEFFHPDIDTQREFGISSDSLVPALISSRNLKRGGVRTSTLSKKAIGKLFRPDGRSESMTTGDRGYVTHGEFIGVNQRYKCRVRDPWYQVPYVKVPDLLLTVFSERPVLVINDVGLVASNSLLCGYMKNTDADRFASSWYTSLTLLHMETEVHSLGGGVMVLVPREASNVKVVTPDCIRADSLTKVNEKLLSGDIEGAYRIGDSSVLTQSLGLSSDEVDLIHEGIDTLASWRTSSRNK